MEKTFKLLEVSIQSSFIILLMIFPLNQLHSKEKCPIGFIQVPINKLNNNFVKNSFCVMKHEAKKYKNKISTDIKMPPWAMITQANAKKVCQGMGEGYQLISNREWMAIARNIESQNENWTGKKVGVGCLKKGNVGSKQPCQNVSSGYLSVRDKEVDFGPLRNPLAQLKLSNNNEIWDMSGNLWEWIDWERKGEYANSIKINNNIGLKNSWKKSERNVVHRGRSWNDGTYASIYTFLLFTSDGVKDTDVGFRCTFSFAKK